MSGKALPGTRPTVEPIIPLPIPSEPAPTPPAPTPPASTPPASLTPPLSEPNSAPASTEIVTKTKIDRNLPAISTVKPGIQTTTSIINEDTSTRNSNLSHKNPKISAVILAIMVALIIIVGVISYFIKRTKGRKIKKDPKHTSLISKDIEGSNMSQISDFLPQHHPPQHHPPQHHPPQHPPPQHPLPLPPQNSSPQHRLQRPPSTLYRNPSFVRNHPQPPPKYEHSTSNYYQKYSKLNNSRSMS